MVSAERPPDGESAAGATDDALTAVVRTAMRSRRWVALRVIATAYLGIALGLWLAAGPSRGSVAHALAFVLIGIMQYHLVMSCHEAVHSTLVPGRRLNDFLGTLHGALVGVDFGRYCEQHLAHHRARTLGADPDAYIYVTLLRTPPGLRRAGTLLLGAVGEIVEKIRQKGVALGAGAGSGRGAGGAGSLVVVVMQLALLAVAVASGSVWTYLLYWLGPLLTIAIMLNRTRVFVEHGLPHVRASAESLDELPQQTFDFRSNPLERFVIAPFHFNVHATHHRFPGVPFYELPALSRRLDHAQAASYAGALRRLLLGQ